MGPVGGELRGAYDRASFQRRDCRRVADHYHVVGFELGPGWRARFGAHVARRGREFSIRISCGPRRPAKPVTRTLYLYDRLCHVRAQRFVEFRHADGLYGPRRIRRRRISPAVIGDLVGEISRAESIRANLGEVIGPLALGFLLNFFDWRTSLQIWAIPGLTIGLLYAAFGSEGNLTAPRPRDYRRALWEDVIKNKAVFGLVAVSTLRAMGQTALAVFLPLYLSLHLKLSAGVAAAYMSILFLFAGIAPAFVGWISDRFGYKSLIILFSFLSFATIVAIPFLGSGLLLAGGFGALGALLWALRPVIVSAAMGAAPQELSGSIVALIYGANMGVSFLAPVSAGLIADAYGLPAALHAIAVFPLIAAVITLLLLKPARAINS